MAINWTEAKVKKLTKLWEKIFLQEKLQKN